MDFIKNTVILILTAPFLVSGCSAPTYRQVFREKASSNSKEFLVSKNDLYHATVKALCANNFIIENEDLEKGFILGKMSFQRGRKTIVLLVQSKIVEESENKSVVYLNAMETTEVSYVADRTRFFLFIIPLPGGGGKEASSIKLKEKTVQDKAFYKNFLKTIEKEIRKQTQSKVIDRINDLKSAPERNATESESVLANTTQ
jgi:hypothetical protein